MFQIPAAQKDFQKKAAEIKAAQKADADAAQKRMSEAIAKWNALTSEERQAQEQEMRKNTGSLSEN